MYGKRIRELRKQAGLSQQSLAGLLAVSQDTVSLWECETSVPPTEYLPKLAKIFDVSIDYLLDYTDEL